MKQDLHLIWTFLELNRKYLLLKRFCGAFFCVLVPGSGSDPEMSSKKARCSKNTSKQKLDMNMNPVESIQPDSRAESTHWL